MDAFIKIGELLWVGTCTVVFFVVLGMFTTARFDIVIKFAIPVFGFLLGASMGAYLGNLVSTTGATIGAVIGGVAGVVISLSATRGP